MITARRQSPAAQRWNRGMAKNRRSQNREDKRDEIVAAARALFIDAGFDATAMSRLAAEAGVAANTIYWYFKDKDEVLAAVLEAEVASGFDDYLKQSFTSIGERILWVVERLDRVSNLVNTVHARVEVSETVRMVHERFHAITEGMLRTELIKQGTSDARADALVKICVFTVEGLLSHPVSDAERQQICRELVS